MIIWVKYDIIYSLILSLKIEISYENFNYYILYECWEN